MSQNITDYVQQIVSKLTGNADLLAQFKKDPKQLISGLLGKELEGDVLQQVIQAVQGKVNLEGAAKNAGGLLAKLKGLFGK